MANHSAPALKAAAIAAPETHIKNIRSMNVRIVHDNVETTSGMATRKHSRPPPARSHHESRSWSFAGGDEAVDSYNRRPVKRG